MKYIWFVLYNFIVYPLIFVVGCFFALFNKKLRVGIIGRFKSIGILKHYFINLDNNMNIYWFHAASLGEFYQVKPVMEGLKEIEPDCLCLLSFSSPSGFEYAKSDAIYCRIYMPFDFFWSIYRAFDIIKPRKIIFASYDIWPNIIWIAKLFKIHTNIFSARVKDDSIKLLPGFNSFYRSIYQPMSTIYTVAKKDYTRINFIIGNRNQPIIRTLGNPRYDMVKKSSDNFTKTHQNTVVDREKRIIIGSSHPEDDEVIIPGLIKQLKNDNNFSIFYVPHEPNQINIDKIISKFDTNGFSSTISNTKIISKIPDKRIVIINTVGILNQLYWFGKIAYIGGGFSSGIHNVMEPAIARLPVIFGPRYHQAHEAEEMLKYGGGICIKKENEFENSLQSLLNDNKYFKKVSLAATNVIHKNLGSSTRIIRSLIRD